MRIPKNEKTCYIFAAVPMPCDQETEEISEDDLVIAADGGYKTAKQRGVRVDVCLGDFDSLGSIPDGDFELLRYPVRKDDTDTGLAVKHGLSEGYRRFVIYGGLGGERRSHTFSNFQTAAFASRQGARVYLVEKNGFTTSISSGQSIYFPVGSYAPDAKLSVFTMSGTSSGVRIANMKYELEDGELRFDYPLGEGNGFVGKDAEIGVKNGNLLIIYEE